MIKKILIISILFSSVLYADDNKIILEEIKQLRADMNKRFEQVDKRFEQVDKRLDFMQNILYILMGLVFASPFIAIYLRDKKESEEKAALDKVKSLIIVMRELAQDDPKIKRSMDIVGL